MVPRLSPADTIRGIAECLSRIDADKKVGPFGVARAIDLLLDARELARSSIQAMHGAGASDELRELFRLAMALVELRIDDFIRAQPDSTPEEDQRLVNAILEPLNDIGGRLPELEAIESRSTPIQ